MSDTAPDVLPVAAKKEAPFAFTSPSLHQQLWDGGGEYPRELVPAAEAQRHAVSMAEQAASIAESIRSDRNLSEVGKRAAYTERVMPLLTKAREYDAKLAEVEQAIMAEGESLIAQADVEPAIAGVLRQERLALAQAFRQLSPAERTAAMQDAFTGRDQLLRDALAYSAPLVSGVGEQQQRALRELVEGGKVDAEAQARIEAKARLLAGIRRTMSRAVTAVEHPADRAALRKANATGLYRSDLATTKEKSDYITKHGLKAFQALPD
jgi:hypothetical protein